MEATIMVPWNPLWANKILSSSVYIEKPVKSQINVECREGGFPQQKVGLTESATQKMTHYLK